MNWIRLKIAFSHVFSGSLSTSDIALLSTTLLALMACGLLLIPVLIPAIIFPPIIIAAILVAVAVAVTLTLTSFIYQVNRVYNQILQEENSDPIRDMSTNPKLETKASLEKIPNKNSQQLEEMGEIPEKLNVVHQKINDLFLKAAEEGRIDSLKTLLNAGADKNSRSNSDENALHLAVKNGHMDVVAYCLDELKLPLEQSASNGRTPFLCAAEKGDFKLLKELHRRGANIHARAGYSGTALTLLDRAHRLDYKISAEALAEATAWLRDAQQPKPADSPNGAPSPSPLDRSQLHGKNLPTTNSTSKGQVLDKEEQTPKTGVEKKL